MLEDIDSDTDAERDVRSLAREIIGQYADVSRVLELDESETFDADLYRRLAEAGLIGLDAEATSTRPPDPGLQTVVLEELGAGPTSMGVSFVVQYMAVNLLTELATAEQRAVYLEPLLSGSARFAFALSEADAGTDVARAMRVRAERAEGGWSISGSKMWISGAATSAYAIVLARTEDRGASAIDGITMFVLPLDSPGITIRELKTVAIHSLDTCEVVFDSVAVSDAQVLGEPQRGFRQVLATLNSERLNAAAVALGIARAALIESLSYSRQREAFGRRLGGFQALQHRLVDDLMAVEAARGLLTRAVLAYRGGRPDADALTALAKLSASEAAIACTDNGMRLFGGAGLSREFSMQRLWRDARLYTFAPLTNEMIRNFVGQHSLGLDRSF